MVSIWAVGYFKNADGSMSCSDHGVDFKPPFGCPECAGSTAQDLDDEGGDADIRSAIAEGLPTLRDHERWCIALSKEAKHLAAAHAVTETMHGCSPSAAGPAYLRVALSARIEAARMADARERRAWILDVERARAKSGSRAPSSQPPNRIARIGDPLPRRDH